MPFPYLLPIAGAVILVLMALLWLLSLQLQNASIIDIFWGLGFIIVTWLAFALTPQGYLPRKLLLGILVTIWGLRLAIHIGIRSLGKAEDFRYFIDQGLWRRDARTDDEAKARVSRLHAKNQCLPSVVAEVIGQASTSTVGR